MKAVSGKEFAKLLETKGWELRRTNGSHHIYAKAEHPARISEPIHGNRLLKTGLLNHLMKAFCEWAESQLLHRHRDERSEEATRSASARAACPESHGKAFFAALDCHAASRLAMTL